MVKGRMARGTFREQRESQRNPNQAPTRTRTNKRGTFREQKIVKKDTELIKRITRNDKKKIKYASKLKRIEAERLAALEVI